MNIPVQTQIMDLVEVRLKNIAETNGYFSTLEKIERARTTPFKNGDLPAINYYYTGDVLEKPLNTGNEERTLVLIVEYYDDTRDRIFLDLADELTSDIKISLERDPASPLVSDQVSNLLGKKVMKLEFDTITPAIGEGQSPYCGTIMLINITYRVNRNDPFALIN